jgi:hypothetical protein
LKSIMANIHNKSGGASKVWAFFILDIGDVGVTSGCTVHLSLYLMNHVNFMFCANRKVKMSKWTKKY